MATIKPDIELIRGDSSSIKFTLQGVDLTGATVFFTAKSEISDDLTDSDAAIAVEVTDHSNPTAGETIIPLTPTDTNVDPGVYFYDIQVKKGSTVITSIRARKLEVFADVTRRTS